MGNWIIIGVILATWLGMAFTSPTKEIRNRRLFVIGAAVILGLLLRHFHVRL